MWEPEFRGRVSPPSVATGAPVVREILRACRLHSAGQRIPSQPVLSLPRSQNRSDISTTSPDLFQISIGNKSKLESSIEGKKIRGITYITRRLKYRIERFQRRASKSKNSRWRNVWSYVYIHIHTQTNENTRGAKEKINGLPSFSRSFSLLSRRLREERRRRREGGRGSAVCGEIQISTERSLRRARPAQNRFRPPIEERRGRARAGPVPYPLRANSWPIRKATASGRVGPAQHAARSSGRIANTRSSRRKDPSSYRSSKNGPYSAPWMRYRSLGK